MDKSIPDKKDLTIIAFDKPIIKTFSQNFQDWQNGYPTSITFGHEI